MAEYPAERKPGTPLWVGALVAVLVVLGGIWVLHLLFSLAVAVFKFAVVAAVLVLIGCVLIAAVGGRKRS